MSLLYELPRAEANRHATLPQTPGEGQASYPSGEDIHTVYVTGQFPAGGPVSTMASPVVRSDTTRRGTTPNSDTEARDEPSSTGRRPVRSIEVPTCSTEADDEPAAIDAVGTPQSTRTVSANWAAVEAFTNTTLADGPIESHSEEAAVTDPAYVDAAPTPRSRTRLANLDSPDE